VWQPRYRLKESIGGCLQRSARERSNSIMYKRLPKMTEAQYFEVIQRERERENIRFFTFILINFCFFFILDCAILLFRKARLSLLQKCFNMLLQTQAKRPNIYFLN
jgi:hypothetical protein